MTAKDTATTQCGKSSVPNVRVLLATYNGAVWLDEQLQSVFDQTGVSVSVVASDDASTDGTPQRLADWSARSRLSVLPRVEGRFGNAHRNFLRLIREAPLGDAEFVALSDQDDVWLPAKLDRATHCLRVLPADAYSSDVVAFWPDGSRRLIRKSQPQRSTDYLFGSPGPGCTFVMRRAMFERMRDWVATGFEQLQGIWVHDWLIYAYVRGHGLRWHIDDQPNMLYRQHGRNEIGVNAGWRAALSRWRHVRSGAYRRDILAIARSIGEASPAVTAIRRLNIRDRLWLVRRVRDFRRGLFESLLLAVLLLCMPKDSPR
jgi:rhamnosyltransferase